MVNFFCYFKLFSYCYITHCKPCRKVYIYFQIKMLLAGNDMFQFPLEVWECIGYPFHSLNDQKYISPYNIGGLASSQVVRRLKNINLRDSAWINTIFAKVRFSEMYGRHWWELKISILGKEKVWLDISCYFFVQIKHNWYSSLVLKPSWCWYPISKFSAYL